MISTKNLTHKIFLRNTYLHIFGSLKKKLYFFVNEWLQCVKFDTFDFLRPFYITYDKILKSAGGGYVVAYAFLFSDTSDLQDKLVEQK